MGVRVSGYEVRMSGYGGESDAMWGKEYAICRLRVRVRECNYGIA